MLKFSFLMQRAGTNFRLGRIILPLPFFWATFPKSSSILYCNGLKEIHGTSRILTSPISQPVRKRPLKIVTCCWVGFSSAGAVHYRVRWDSNHSSFTEGRVQSLAVRQQTHFHSNIVIFSGCQGDTYCCHFPALCLDIRCKEQQRSTQLSPLHRTKPEESSPFGGPVHRLWAQLRQQPRSSRPACPMGERVPGLVGAPPSS